MFVEHAIVGLAQGGGLLGPRGAVGLVDPLHGRGEGTGGEAQRGEAGVAKLPGEAEGALDGDAAIAEGVGGENFGGEGFFGLGGGVGGFASAGALGLGGGVERLRGDGGEVAEGAGDRLDVVVAHLVAFRAEGFAHLAVKVDAVDELHAALAVGGLFVGEDPDVGRDAGVVEHVGRQGDDGFEQVALEEVAADLALAGTGAAGEERGAI